MSGQGAESLVSGARLDRAPPFVTVVMPIRNEARYIEQSLGALLAQDYPANRVELLIVDGMSDDGTREIVKRLLADRQRQDRIGPVRIRLIDNPSRVVPTALNLAIQRATGDIVIRVDGHSRIAPDYVRRCVEMLEENRADCVGGPLITIGETWVARGIALAQSSLFGVGGVAFRTRLHHRGYVDTVPFGAYRREVFSRIGVFDEELVRNQDDEFNFRLIQSGGRVWLDPSIRSVYHSRTSLAGFWRQYFQYGFYKFRVIQKRGGVASWRHLVPAALVLALAGGLVLTGLTKQPVWLVVAAGPYVVANVMASLWVSRRDVRALPILPLAFATTHLAYGLGFIVGAWRWGVQMPSIRYLRKTPS